MRGCLALVRTAKVWALAEGRSQVLPDDVKSLAEPVLCHRLILDPEAMFNGVTVEDVIGDLLTSVPAPQERVA
jgi:MoxR-like ATPase